MAPITSRLSRPTDIRSRLSRTTSPTTNTNEQKWQHDKFATPQQTHNNRIQKAPRGAAAQRTVTIHNTAGRRTVSRGRNSSGNGNGGNIGNAKRIVTIQRNHVKNSDYDMEEEPTIITYPGQVQRIVTIPQPDVRITQQIQSGYVPKPQLPLRQSINTQNQMQPPQKSRPSFRQGAPTSIFPQPADTKVTVKLDGFHVDATEQDLQTLFLEFQPTEVPIIERDSSGNSTGRGSIVFPSDDIASAAIAKFNNQTLDNMVLKMKKVLIPRSVTAILQAHTMSASMSVMAPSPSLTGGMYSDKF